jgi:hypothetical protein
LPGLHAPVIAKALQGGERRERHRRSLLERKVRRLPLDRLARDQVFRERATLAAVYLVAGCEAVHADPDRFTTPAKSLPLSLDLGFNMPISGRAT